MWTRWRPHRHLAQENLVSADSRIRDLDRYLHNLISAIATLSFWGGSLVIQTR